MSSRSRAWGTIGIIGIAGLGIAGLVFRQRVDDDELDDDELDGLEPPTDPPTDNESEPGPNDEPLPDIPVIIATADPIEDPLAVKAYPEAGAFYQVKSGDRLLGTTSSITHRVLLSEGYIAATKHGKSKDEANQFALSVSTGSARLKMADLIQCSGWNDALYGADPLPGTRISPHGRSILLRPQHANIYKLLKGQQQPIRNIRRQKGTGAITAWKHYELLWIPAVDREALWESGGKKITTLGMWWADGSTKENPAPSVMALGMADETGDLDEISSWGCPGADGELEIS